MAVDPVGATLASIGVFIQFYNICDTLVHGYKLTLQFGDDFSAVQRELDMQWARLHLLMQSRRVLRSEIDPEDPNNTMSTTITNHLGQMQRYFQVCHNLIKKYSCEEDCGTNHLATSIPTSTTAAGGPNTSASSDTTFLSFQANPKSTNSSRWDKLNVFKKSEKAVSSDLDIKGTGRRKAANVKVPELEIQEVQDAAAAAEQNSIFYQEKVNFWRRSRWAKRDQDDLRTAISQLRQGNNNLESILRLLALKDPSLFLPSSDHADSLWPLVTRVSKTLGALHQHLMRLNVKRNDHAPYFLSLRLSEDHQKSRRELEDYVSLQDGSQVFNLQRQLTNKTGEASKLLLVQSYQQHGRLSEQAVNDSLLRLENIDRPKEAQNVSEDNEIERWGCFGNSVNNDWLHILYHDTGNDWICTNTLRDVLEGTEFRECITPVQVVQLAKILLCSYLYLDHIYGGTKVPRPLNYCFYKTSDEEESWNPDDPRVLRPWLSFGFGRRPPKAKLGGGNGIADSGGLAMAELGILLYQIGSGIAMDYGAGATALKQAKSTALGNIHALELRMGFAYAEIVQGFLEFEARPSYLLSPDDENQETEYVKRVISALMKLEHDFEDTAIAPMLFEPDDPVPENKVADIASAVASADHRTPSMSATTAGPLSISTAA